MERNKEETPRPFLNLPQVVGNLNLEEEFDSLRSQIATSNGRGGRRYRPYMFTEQGIAMHRGSGGCGRFVEADKQVVQDLIYYFF